MYAETMNSNYSPQQDPPQQTMTIRSSIFGQELGPIISTHSCSYHRQKGKLFISPDCLCYYSNILGFERKITIRIQDIKYASLHRTTSIMIRSAVCNNDSFLSSGAEGEQEERQETLEQHIFRSFTDRQSVLQLILNVYEALTGREFSNTDVDDKRYNIVDAVQDESTFATPLRKIIPRKSQKDNGLSSNGLVELDHSIVQDGMLLESTALEPAGDGTVDFHEALSSPPRSRCSTQDESFLHRGHGTDEVGALAESEQTHGNVARDTKKEWERVLKETCTVYSEVAVERKILPISLDRFFALFLADDATKSMSFFQGNIIQDDNVECSRWKLLNNSSSSSALMMDGYKEFTRQITSRHNRNARVGPKIVPLERRQTLRRFSNFGIVINTILNMEGVPYGDMFEMQDEWIIESCNQGEIALSVRFKIHFTKRPMAMIRKVIRDQSRKEISTWFKMYMEMIQETVGGEMEVCPNIIPLKDRIRTAFLLFVRCVVGLLSSRLFSSAILCILVYCYICVFDRLNTLESALHDIQIQNDYIMEKLDAMWVKEQVQPQQENVSQCFTDF
jgi:GRAM domain.